MNTTTKKSNLFLLLNRNNKLQSINTEVAIRNQNTHQENKPEQNSSLREWEDVGLTPDRV